MNDGNYSVRGGELMPNSYRRMPNLCGAPEPDRGDIFLRVNYPAMKALGDVSPTRWADMSTCELIDAANRHLAGMKFTALRVSDRFAAIAALIGIRG